MRPRIPEDVKKRILQAHKENGFERTRMLADHLGLPASLVAYVLRRNGVHLMGGWPGVCTKWHGKLMSMANSGVSVAHIARVLGTNTVAVRRYTQRHRILIRPFLQIGPNNPAWKGGRVVDKDGYILLWLPDHPAANHGGYVREHRVVMEQKLGRYLTPEEVVHHQNKNHEDNIPGNLKLYPSNGAHLSDELTGVPCPARGRKRKPTRQL